MFDARIEKLQALQEELLLLPIVRDYLKFRTLSPEEKRKQTATWTEYYERVKTSNAYMLYQEQKALVGRLAGVKGSAEEFIKKQIREKARQARELLADGIEDPLDRPNFRDPYEYHNSSKVQQYQICEKVLNGTLDTTAKRTLKYLT